jgi:predicted porin
MKNALTIATLLGLAGAAQAQVSLYGLIDMSYGKNNIGVSATEKEDFHSGGDNGSSQGNSTTRVGVKGSTDVGSGVKANFKLETGGITSQGEVNPGGAFFNRQAWAGLSGSFGEVRLGKQDGVAFQTMVGFDLNGAANAAAAQLNSLAGTWLGAGGRQDRSLQYITPKMSGFTAQVGYQPEGNVVGAEGNASLGLSYAAGPLAVAITGEGKRTKTGTNFSAVAGSYDFGGAKVMLGYADGGQNAKGTTVGFSVPLAGTTVGMNYSKNSDTSAVATEFFVNREIFKGTYAYLDYADLDRANGPFTQGKAYAAGVIFTF